MNGPRPVSFLNYLDWDRQNTVFERMAAVSWGSVTVGEGTPVYVAGSFVSPAYFELFGLRATIGRTFALDEGEPGHERVVVLSHRLWVSQFGADPAVVGRPIRLDRQLYTVIGVMPPRTSVDFIPPQLWRPLTFDVLPSRGSRQLQKAVARLKEGATLAQARVEMTVIADRLAREYPDSNKGYSVLVEAYPRPIGFDVEQSLYLLLPAVVVVLLIACVNLANLALVRGAARAHEVAIRTALGAGRARLIRQFLTEHLLIAACGVLCGIAVGSVMRRAMTVLIPTEGLRAAFPPDTAIAMDAPVWLFALGVCLISGIAFGLTPAIASTRVTLTDAMKTDGGPGISAGPTQRRSRQILVVAEVALAFVLVAAAALLIRGFFSLTDRIETGFDSTNVLTAGLPTPATRFKSGAELNVYLDEIASRIEHLPRIETVAFADSVPPQGTPYGKGFQIVGKPPVASVNRPSAGFKVVSPSYFRAVGLRLLDGRVLDERDREGAPFVIVINQTFARTYFQGGEALGQRMIFYRAPIESGATASGPGRETMPPVDFEWTIVGITADEGVSPFDDRVAEPAIYATREQYPRSNLMLVVRTSGDPTSEQVLALIRFGGHVDCAG